MAAVVEGVHCVAGVGERAPDVRVAARVLDRDPWNSSTTAFGLAVGQPGLVIDGQTVGADEDALAVLHPASLAQAPAQVRDQKGSCQDGAVATRKPIPAEYQIHDGRFLDLIVPGARAAASAHGGLWAEGPVYLPDSTRCCGATCGATGACGSTCRPEVSLHMQPANFNNGHTRDADGR